MRTAWKSCLGATVLVALAACSGPATTAGESETTASATASSPSPAPAGEGRAAYEELANHLRKNIKAYDGALAALYAELGVDEPSLRTIHELAGDASDACRNLQEAIETATWPKDIAKAASDMSGELTKLARFYDKMSAADSPDQAMDIIELVETKYDRVPAAKVAYALGLR